MILMAIFSTGIYAQKTIHATTEDGRKVLLKSDGTWVFQPETKGVSLSTSSVPPGADSEVTGRHGFYKIAYEKASWKLEPKPDPPSEFFFEQKEGDVYAMVIAERLEIPLETLKEVALENARSVGEDVTVMLDEKRVVNGVEILAMQFSGVIQGIPFVYYGYYWTGPEGSLQVLTFTGKNLFREYEAVMKEFLDGLTIQTRASSS